MIVSVKISNIYLSLYSAIHFYCIIRYAPADYSVIPARWGNLKNKELYYETEPF